VEEKRIQPLAVILLTHFYLNHFYLNFSCAFKRGEKQFRRAVSSPARFPAFLSLP